MKFLKTFLLRVLLMIVLISQFAVYMIYPSCGNTRSHLTLTHPIQSYDDYLVEYILNIPDTTPKNENDDVERRLPIVQVEHFHLKQKAETVSYSLSASDYPILSEFLHTSYHAEIIVPPPQG